MDLKLFAILVVFCCFATVFAGVEYNPNTVCDCLQPDGTTRVCQCPGRQTGSQHPQHESVNTFNYPRPPHGSPNVYGDYVKSSNLHGHGFHFPHHWKVTKIKFRTKHSRAAFLFLKCFIQLNPKIIQIIATNVVDFTNMWCASLFQLDEAAYFDMTSLEN